MLIKANQSNTKYVLKDTAINYLLLNILFLEHFILITIISFQNKKN